MNPYLVSRALSPCERPLQSQSLSAELLSVPNPSPQSQILLMLGCPNLSLKNSIADCTGHSWRIEGVTKSDPKFATLADPPLSALSPVWVDLSPPSGRSSARWRRCYFSPGLPHHALNGWPKTMPSWCPRYDLNIPKLKEEKENRYL